MSQAALSQQALRGIGQYQDAWRALGARLPVDIERLMLMGGWLLSVDARLAEGQAVYARTRETRLLIYRPGLSDLERRALAGFAVAVKLESPTLPFMRLHCWWPRYAWPDVVARRSEIAARLLIPDEALAECRDLGELMALCEVPAWIALGRLWTAPLAARLPYLRHDRWLELDSPTQFEAVLLGPSAPPDHRLASASPEWLAVHTDGIQER